MERAGVETLRGKNIIVLGTEKQKRDLEFVFSLDRILGHISEMKEVAHWLDQMEVLLVCNGFYTCVDEMEAGVMPYRVVFDKELISTLAFPFEELAKEKKIAIWGTGFYANYFVSYLKEKNKFAFIDCFFDNNAKEGEEKEGIPVLTSEEATPDKYFIIIATGIEFLLEIASQIRVLGYEKKQYAYYDQIEKNAEDLFWKTYNETTYIQAECKNLDYSVRVDKLGHVCICCMAYAGVYGNLFAQDFLDIWNSLNAKVCRLSLLNHTYSFCAKDRCPFLSGSNRVETNEYSEKFVYPFQEYPDSVAPEVDYSCNLYCTSCRKEIFIENNKERELYAEMVCEKLSDIPSRLIINTVGEIFASKNSAYILRNKDIKQREQLSIYTNGTLVTKKILEDLVKTYKDLEFAVSIDAATKETYEKIRRGGSFEKILETMDWLSKFRAEGKVSYLQVNYVVQSENVSEMQTFVAMAKEWNVDRIAMNGLEQWGTYTDEEFEKMSIWRDGEIKAEFLPYFTKELIEDEQVNFFNISNHIGAEPKKMYMV